MFSAVKYIFPFEFPDWEVVDRFKIRKNSRLLQTAAYMVWLGSADELLISCSVNFAIYCMFDWWKGAIVN